MKLNEFMTILPPANPAIYTEKNKPSVIKADFGSNLRQIGRASCRERV